MISLRKSLTWTVVVFQLVWFWCARQSMAAFTDKDGSDAITLPVRAFVIAFLKNRGYLVLEAYKFRKGVYHQLPGGRVELTDVNTVLKQNGKLDANDCETIARTAAVRELYEETGIHIEANNTRLVNLAPRGIGTRKTFFFELELDYFDSATGYRPYARKVIPQTYDDLSQMEYFTLFGDSQSFDTTAKFHDEPQPEKDDVFIITLSPEHKEAYFVPSLATAASLVQGHSDGRCSAALRRYAKLT